MVQTGDETYDSRATISETVPKLPALLWLNPLLLNEGGAVLYDEADVMGIDTCPSFKVLLCIECPNSFSGTLVPSSGKCGSPRCRGTLCLEAELSLGRVRSSNLPWGCTSVWSVEGRF